MMKKMLLLTLLLILGLFARAQELQCTFTSKTVNPSDGTEITGEGILSYTVSGEGRTQFKVPEGQDFIGGNAALRTCVLNCLGGRYVKAAWQNDADTVIGEKDGVKTVTLKARNPGGSPFARIDIDYREDGLPVRLSLEGPGGESSEFEFQY
jgi:hypothetical protein